MCVQRIQADDTMISMASPVVDSDDGAMDRSVPQRR